MKWPTILGLSLLALVAVGGAWSRLSSAVAVDVARVTAGPIRASIEERGKTRLPKTYLVTMPYEGRIEAIDLAEGDTVEQGQIVARIVTDDLKLKLDRATATVERFDAALAENDDTRIEQVALKQAHSFAGSVGETVKAAAARVTAARLAVALTEQGFEEVAELFATKTTGAGKTAITRTPAAAEFKTFVPVRRWSEILPAFPVGTQLIVCRALFRIFQNLVGFSNFLEAVLGIRFSTDIGMILAGKFAISALDLVLRRIARNAHDFVVIPEFHQSVTLFPT